MTRKTTRSSSDSANLEERRSDCGLAGMSKSVLLVAAEKRPGVLTYEFLYRLRTRNSRNSRLSPTKTQSSDKSGFSISSSIKDTLKVGNKSLLPNLAATDYLFLPS